jgi:hypothetical protein
MHTPYDPLAFLDDNFDFPPSHSMDIQNNNSSPGLFTDYQSYESLSPAKVDELSNSLDLFDPSRLMEHAVAETSSRNSQHAIFTNNARLSKLNLDLTYRTDQCLKSSLEGTSPLGESQLQTTRSDNGTADPLFGQALNDLSEFITIIQLYTPKKPGLASGGSTSGFIGQRSSSTPNPRIGLVVFIGLVAAYLQIVIVYDKLLHSLSSQLFEESPELSGSSRKAGELHLNGITGTMQTKIVLHAILHQFGIAERMLGIPVDLRVTETQTVYAGIFADDRARGILGAVSDGSRIECGWGHATADEPRISEALCNLKENLKLVQMFLET